MVAKKMVGSEASARKYDLLTALSVSGLASGPTSSTSMMRLIALITARYNWKNDEVSVGQAEMARLWSVDLRTVKREIKRLRELDLLLIKKPGVRGRVATYSLNHDAIANLTGSTWPLVGADFEERMKQDWRSSVAASTGKVVQFPAPGDSVPDDSTFWGQCCKILADENFPRYQRWFATLEFQGKNGGIARLSARSRFYAEYIGKHYLVDIQRAMQMVCPDIREVIIISQ